jgi:hypothetical protein
LVVAAQALTVLVPDVGVLSWDDIDGIRRQRGWDALRGLWTEVGEAAMDPGRTPEEVTQLIKDEYEGRLREAALATEGPRASRWAGTATGLVLGSLPTIAGVPLAPALAGGVVSAAAGFAVDHLLRTPPARWLSADQAMRDAILNRLVREDVEED